MAISDFSDEVYAAIKAYLIANWNHAPFAWPNEPFEVGSDGAGFVAVEVLGTMYGQQSIGAEEQADNRWDEEGQLLLHVSVQRGRGFSQSRGAGKSLANLFRGTRLLSDRLEFMDAQIGPGQGGDDDGIYHVTTVAIDWRLMEA